MNNQFILSTYKPYPIHFVSGKGAKLKDKQEHQYIDFLSGLGVNNLGYGNKKVIKTIQKASKKPLHLSNLFEIENQQRLAQKISQHSFEGKAFFCNSGAEGIEAAIKFLIKHAVNNKIKNPIILTAKNSFHGRTIGALTATGQQKYQNFFKPLLPYIKHFEFNNEKDLEKKFNQYKKRIVGVITEIIQGEGGVYPITKKFFSSLQKNCKKNSSLLFIDEVQSGCSRTGKFLAFQNYTKNVEGFVLAKSLAGGLPIGCLFVAEKYSNTFQPGDHASTFGGNPFVSQVSLTALEELNQQNLLNSVIEKSNWIKNQFIDKDKYSIKEIRGIGLMLGIEFKSNISTDEIAQKCLEEKLIINSIKNKIIRITPPLIISMKEFQKGIEVLKKSILS